MSNKEIVQKWNDFVKDSKGNAVRLPEKFDVLAERVEEMRKAYNKRAQEMAKDEITLNINTQNMFFELRKFLSENGRPDIWVKEIGFNLHALEEGEFIINIHEQQGH